MSCDTDTEVMCNENKGHVSSFKSLLLACQVCILSFMKINVEFFVGHVIENAGCSFDEGASGHGHS